jgi:hypothetical protein
MFIAHLPAGYLVSKFLCTRMKVDEVNPKAFMAAGLLGSVAPDLDLLYDRLADGGLVHHHSYFTHYPLTWSLLILLVIALHNFNRLIPAANLALIFSLNGFVHLMLDSVVGDIRWLAPFYTKYFSLAHVPAVYHPWWVNFLLHWSFAIEIAIVTAAFLVWRHARGRRRPLVQVFSTRSSRMGAWYPKRWKS